MHGKRWAAAIVIVVGLGLSGCVADPPESAADKGTEVAKVSAVNAAGTRQVTLTRDAADRWTTHEVPADSVTDIEPTTLPVAPNAPSWIRYCVPQEAEKVSVEFNVEAAQTASSSLHAMAVPLAGQAAPA